MKVIFCFFMSLFFFFPQTHLIAYLKWADCFNCSTTGVVEEWEECRECHGNVETMCFICEGLGEELCWSCFGKGVINAPCQNCEGLGFIDEARCEICKGERFSIKTCSTCLGFGKATCSECEGEGVIVCPLCYGSGGKKKWVSCPECRGNGGWYK